MIQELQHPRTPAIVKHWAQSPPSWLRVDSPSASIASTAGLDPGEAQAIALAVELGADALLIDEKKGRRIAKSRGFVTLGTTTVLELAAEDGLLDLKSAFDALQQTTFHITQHLLDEALARDAKRKAQRGANP
ncbi:MAG TPA: hypothetical protein VJ828_02520 [Lacipirellulaceae bacterium]|nr:hypothetical protein [Lacipirellulaceae bacterium]